MGRDALHKLGDIQLFGCSFNESSEQEGQWKDLHEHVSAGASAEIGAMTM